MKQQHRDASTMYGMYRGGVTPPDPPKTYCCVGGVTPLTQFFGAAAVAGGGDPPVGSGRSWCCRWGVNPPLGVFEVLLLEFPLDPLDL